MEAEQLALRVEQYRNLAKRFCFAVLLSKYRCPRCGSKLRLVGPSEAACECGVKIDPTVVFQKSECCHAGVVRKKLHYACSICSRSVSSMFLFGERSFDQAYFRERMAESRKRKHRQQLLLQSVRRFGSGELLLLEEPRFLYLPGFVEDLDTFIGSQTDFGSSVALDADREFDMARYSAHVLKQLGESEILFRAIAPLDDDARRDKAWLFATLVFMEHEQQVNLTQYGEEILVERYEADIEG